MDQMFMLAADAAGSGEAVATGGLFSAAGLTALLALTALEIVLGVDNVIFIAILSEKVEQSKQALARNLGLLLAMVMRIGLLFAATAVLSLEQMELFTLPFADLLHIEHPGISIKDLILFAGGAFLLGKAVWELRHMATHRDAETRATQKKVAASLGGVLVQIMLLDLVFSVDSVITAVGMTDQLLVMIIAVMIAVGVMMAFAKPLAGFVKRHPDIKVLALAFLVMIGFLLIVESVEVHVPRGYVYFAMAFALTVDLVQMRVEKAEG